MKKQLTLFLLIFISSIAFSQEKQDLVDKLKESTKIMLYRIQFWTFNIMSNLIL